MRRIFFLIFVISAIAAGAVYFQSTSTPCNRVLSYSIGTFDPRFGITQDQFIKAVADEELVWEQPVGKQLFMYDSSAKFKINLIYDERQQRTIDEHNLRSNIDLSSNSYDNLVGQYNNLNFQHSQDVATYEQAQADYQQKLKDYNTEVAYWNKQGGAPAADYQRLSEQKRALTVQAQSLENQRQDLNAQVSDLNALAARVNTIAKQLNVDVKDYNGKFGSPRQFDEGTYTGSAINIYQFNDETDLRLVLAHEFGHAIGLEHVSDPQAIMYYLMDKQDLDNIHVTQADLDELKSVCKLN